MSLRIKAFVGKFFFIAVLVNMLITSAFSEEYKLDIFGYVQSRVGIGDNKISNKRTSSFAIQQLNLFFQRNFTDNFSALVNLELTNNFSSDKKWGTLALEEAWCKYSNTNMFNLKFGLLVPTFNNFNELKTKFPLFPYLYRPLVYESSLGPVLDIQAFLPTNANVQCYGTVPMNAFKLDYALFGGNSQFINTVSSAKAVAGMDTTMYKLIGTRVGARFFDVKLGVSGVYDWDPGTTVNKYVTQLNAALPTSMAQYKLPLMVELRRFHVGTDLSYSKYGFTIEGEYIYVWYDVTSEGKDILHKISSPILPGGAFDGLYGVIGESLKKQFYYGTVMYDILSNFSAFAGYSRIQDEVLVVIKDGMHTFYGGLMYKPIDEIAVKFNVVNFRLVDNEDPLVVSKNAQVNLYSYILGVSFVF